MRAETWLIVTSVLFVYLTADFNAVANDANKTLTSAPDIQLLATTEPGQTEGDKPSPKRGGDRRLSFHRGSGRQKLPDIG
jgi:hypothetical protein